jgi:hypothetical protein
MYFFYFIGKYGNIINWKKEKREKRKKYVREKDIQDGF